ncbi:MAG: sulfatase, partial [Acidobacteria bacterium]|nr:sulfatase [Acidobacteriota bacterium]
LVALWWVACVLLHILAFAGAVLEQGFFLHTESRLNFSLLRYGWENFQMLHGLILSGVDSRFFAQARLAGAALLLGFLLSFLFRTRKRRLFDWMAPAGLLTLLVPATTAVTEADLAPSTLGELLRSPGVSAKIAARASEHTILPQDLYQRPTLVGGEALASVEPPLNIVLLVMESTRFDLLAPYTPAGRELAPNLARIAEESWVVESMYTTVSHTSKALIGILCGMFPRLSQPITETLESSLPLTCLPHLLGEAGYRTVFLQTARSSFENRPGLVRNLGYQSGAFMETMERPGFETIGYLGIDEFAMLEPVESFLDGAGSMPFFLTLLTLTPHHPYDVAGQPPPSRQTGPFHQYLEALRHQDRFVGEVYRLLESRGLLENTVFILLGDHGEAFGEHKRRQHDIVPYEEVVRVPMFLRVPARLGEPRKVTGLRQLTDLMPTLLSFTGLPWEGRLPGRDLRSADGAERVVTSCWYTDYCLSMREGSRKFVYHYGIRPTEVFDLAADPWERQNLARNLDPLTVAEAEERMLAAKLSFDAFWAAQPVPGDDPLWWSASP